MPLKIIEHISDELEYQGGKSKADIQYEGRLHKLSSNENLLGSSPLAIAAIQNQLLTLNQYPPRTDQDFTKALEHFYNGELKQDQFFTSNGGVSVLELIIRAFIAEGDEYIYSSPFFRPYHSFSKKVGGVGVDVPLSQELFEIDVEGILRSVTEKTKLIFVNNPNNPTGTYSSKSQIDILIDHLPDHVILVYDEVYHHFVTTSNYVRALPYVMEGKNVIGINSFSKAYGLAGLRIGYGYSTPEITKYIKKLRIPFMINSLSMSAAIAALGDTDFIEKSCSLIKAEKAYLYEELRQLKVKYWNTEANFILIETDLESSLLESKLIRHGIRVRPIFSATLKNCVRVTIGTHESNVSFINALQIILNK